MDSVNTLNRKYRANYMKDMRKLKPKKSSYPRGGYGEAVRAWRRTLSFGSQVMHRVNNLNNKIVLKGKPNRSN